MSSPLDALRAATERLEQSTAPEELQEDLTAVLAFVRQRLAIAHDAQDLSQELVDIFEARCRHGKPILRIVFERMGIRTLDELCNMTKEDFEAAFDRAKERGGKQRKKWLINRIIDRLDPRGIPHKLGERIT